MHIEEKPLFQIFSKARMPPGRGEQRLKYVGEPLKDVTDIDVTLDRLVWLKSDVPAGGGSLDRLQLRWPESASIQLTVLLAYYVSLADESGPDSLNFDIPGGADGWESDETGTHLVMQYDRANWVTNTIFHPIEGGVGCLIGDCTFRFKAQQIGFLEHPADATAIGFKGLRELQFTETDLPTLHKVLEERNFALGYEMPASLLASVEGETLRHAIAFNVHTGQEWTAFIQTATDGRSLSHFHDNSQNGTLRHQRPNAAFWTETALTDDERDAGHGLELLQRAASELDLDDGLAWLYISHLMAPPTPLPAHAAAVSWIDLDDVARKTMGGYARNPEEALERRRKVWHAIRYGARSHIGGRRTVPYFDKSTGREIETEINTTPWQILQSQQPVQPSLFPDEDHNLPVRVQLVASREWTALTTSPDTAQYLPLGEVLGSITPSQAAGAWARSLGMAYFQWCRCNVTAALKGAEPPSREALLETFPSKKAPYRSILESPNPKRAIEYWRNAETLLKDANLIETVEPAAPKPALPRKGWQAEWLAASPTWRPGTALKGMLEAIAANKLPERPRSLTKPKRGRPPKKAKAQE